MGKLFVRFTIIFTCLYFIVAYATAQFLCVDILQDWYAIPFEVCVVIYSRSEGKFHCEYIKNLVVLLLFCDIFSRLDNEFNFVSVEVHNLLPLFLLGIGLCISLTLAIRHFIQVTRLRNGRRKTLANKENGISPIGQVEGASNSGL